MQIFKRLAAVLTIGALVILSPVTLKHAHADENHDDMAGKATVWVEPLPNSSDKKVAIFTYFDISDTEHDACTEYKKWPGWAPDADLENISDSSQKVLDSNCLHGKLNNNSISTVGKLGGFTLGRQVRYIVEGEYGSYKPAEITPAEAKTARRTWWMDVVLPKAHDVFSAGFKNPYLGSDVQLDESDLYKYAVANSYMNVIGPNFKRSAQTNNVDVYAATNLSQPTQYYGPGETQYKILDSTITGRVGDTVRIEIRKELFSEKYKNNENTRDWPITPQNCSADGLPKGLDIVIEGKGNNAKCYIVGTLTEQAVNHSPVPDKMHYLRAYENDYSKHAHDATQNQRMLHFIRNIHGYPGDLTPGDGVDTTATIYFDVESDKPQTPAKLKLVDTDAEDNPVTGAQFSIEECKGDVNFKHVFDCSSLSTPTPNENVFDFGDIHSDKTYRISQIKAPEGYNETKEYGYFRFDAPNDPSSIGLITNKAVMPGTIAKLVTTLGKDSDGFSMDPMIKYSIIIKRPEKVVPITKTHHVTLNNINATGDNITGSAFFIEECDGTDLNNISNCVNKRKVNSTTSEFDLGDVNPDKVYRISQFKSPKGYTLVPDFNYFKITYRKDGSTATVNWKANTGYNETTESNKTEDTANHRVNFKHRITFTQSNLGRLPESGGRGWYSFGLIGLLLVISAGSAFITYKN